jgi:glycosyltransferase involved in cell wall biosynthesis
MHSPTEMTIPGAGKTHSQQDPDAADARPTVSLILPAFNEEAILAENVGEILRYAESLNDRYQWDVVIVNDGSQDRTGDIAEQVAGGESNLRVLHHPQNRGLGEAIKTGVEGSSGDYLIVLDMDLSYNAGHIGLLLEELERTGADVVLASPYMKGGSIGNVPWLRKTLSIWANRFLSLVAHGHLSTLTCMVRGYRGDFARSLVLRATGMEVMPETVYKTMILRGRITQIPAHLDWGAQAKSGPRKSSMQIARQILGTLLSGFLFKPFMFFILPGLVLLAFSAWVNAWMIIHFLEALAIAPDGSLMGVYSWAVAAAYQAHPHTFIVGLLSMMLSIQLISLGVLALQSKSYFEEIFYLGSALAARTARDASNREDP